MTSRNLRSFPGRPNRECAAASIGGVARRRRFGFSLIELMIALTILGLGLVMVATLFPVAWTRARQLSEYTTQTAVTESAHATLTLLMKVGSLAGDWIVWNEYGDVVAPPDTRVHALYLENILATGSRPFTPDRDDPSADVEVKGAPFTLEQVDLSTDPEMEDFFFNEAFGAPQLDFEQRVYPALRPRSADPQWDEILNGRRFAWAVLHRLREKPEPDKLDEPREFDVYYITLRRAQSTHRFARQDADQAPDPEIRDDPVPPVARPAEFDVIIPVPWRVQVLFPTDDSMSSEADKIGVPTVVQVNTKEAPSVDFAIDIFQRGASLIDEVNGQIYHIVKKRIAGEDDNEAHLTLDREVFIEDIDDSDEFGGDGVLFAEERLRVVWVFPPPVQPNRLSNNVTPVFEGKHPVVGIDVRTLTVSP